LKVGDIFTIPIDDKYQGIGHLVAFPEKSLLLIAVYDFKKLITDSFSIDILPELKILLLGNTLDAKLYNKHWIVIGNSKSNLNQIKLPIYKIGVYPEAKVLDYEGKFIRQASIDDVENLKYQKVIAPIRYENALKAYYNLKPWIGEDYDSLLYNND